MFWITGRCEEGSGGGSDGVCVTGDMSQMPEAAEHQKCTLMPSRR